MSSAASLIMKLVIMVLNLSRSSSSTVVKRDVARLLLTNTLARLREVRDKWCERGLTRSIFSGGE